MDTSTYTHLCRAGQQEIIAQLSPGGIVRVPSEVDAEIERGRDRYPAIPAVSSVTWAKVVVLDEIRADAAERGLSAYVAEALRLKHDRDRLQELADWLQEEHGPVTEAERAAALGELDELDAEHERRQATENRDAGEAA